MEGSSDKEPAQFLFQGDEVSAYPPGRIYKKRLRGRNPGPFLPGMRNGPGLTSGYAGQRRSIRRRFARPALIFNLLFLVRSNHCQRSIVHGIVRVFIYDLQNIGRARGNAISASITFVGVNGYEIIAGAVAVTVVCEHGGCLIPAADNDFGRTAVRPYTENSKTAISETGAE